MPGPKLTESHIYACLFTRRDGTFHWILAIPHKDGKTVYKFHATEDANGWRYECTNHDIVTSVSACAVVQIGTLRSGVTATDVHRHLAYIPMGTPAEDAPQPWSCRIWLKAAVRKLHEQRIVYCPNVNNLEYELKGIGKEARNRIEMGMDYRVQVSDYSY